MKLGINDIWARGYKVTERMLHICINYANFGHFYGPTKDSGIISAARPLVC